MDLIRTQKSLKIISIVLLNNRIFIELVEPENLKGLSSDESSILFNLNRL